MMNAKLLRLLLFSAGAVFPLALAPFFYWPLGLLSFAGLTFGLTQIQTTRLTFIGAWWFGFGQFLVGVSWIYVSINQFGGTPPILAAFMVAVFAGGLALIPASIFALGHALFKQRLIWLTLPVFWFIAEWVRGNFLTGFPWLFAGDAHLSTWLAGYAPIIGSYGISFLVFLTVTALWQSVRTRNILPLFILTLWPIGAYLHTLEWTSITGQMRVTAVQGNVAQEDKWLPSMIIPTIDRYHQQSAEQWESDLILWPETAVTTALDLFAEEQAHIAKQAIGHQSTIITGIISRSPRNAQRQREYYNSLATFGHSGEQVYHKQKLVPFGEFVPFEQHIRGLLPFFNLEMSSFSAGTKDQPLLPIASQGQLFSVAPFICYEIAYPQQVREMAKTSDFLITVSNDAWFGDSLGPKQHMALAQMRALETGRWLLRSTNTGISALVNHRGEIIDQLPTKQLASLSGVAEMRQGTTPYMHFGLWPLVLISSFILAAATFLTWKNHE